MSGTNEEYDGLLMTVIQKAGGIDNYFDSVFGFLFRKTDFFSNETKSREIMEVQFKKYLTKYQDKIEREKKIKERREKEQAALNKPTEASSATVKEISPEEYLKKKKQEDERRLEQEKEMDKQRKEERRKEEDEKRKAEGKPPREDKKDEEDEDKVKEGHVLPNKEKGQTLDKYSWGQMDIKEITINVPLPKEIRAKDMDIKYDDKKLKVAIKGKEPIIDGELFAPIDSESLIWTIDEDNKGKNLAITFEKREQTWWESVVKGDAVKVDTGKISPEASSLSDIKDPELKAQVEKMMFDTRQKQMGKPTSDILQKCPQIEDFMKAHPEMDFSHAKFG
jgi:hypothetical protein